MADIEDLLSQILIKVKLGKALGIIIYKQPSLVVGNDTQKIPSHGQWVQG